MPQNSAKMLLFLQFTPENKKKLHKLDYRTRPVLLGFRAFFIIGLAFMPISLLMQRLEQNKLFVKKFDKRK